MGSERAVGGIPLAVTVCGLISADYYPVRNQGMASSDGLPQIYERGCADSCSGIASVLGDYEVWKGP